MSELQHRRAAGQAYSLATATATLLTQTIMQPSPFSFPTKNTPPRDGMRISAPSSGTALPVGTRPDGNPDKAPMAYPYKEPRHANVPGSYILYPACPPLSFVPLQKCKIAKNIVNI